MLIAEVALTHVQDLALGLVEPHEVHLGPCGDNRPYESKTRKTGDYFREEVTQNIHFLCKAAGNWELGKGILNFLIFKCSLITVMPLINNENSS